MRSPKTRSCVIALSLTAIAFTLGLPSSSAAEPSRFTVQFKDKRLTVRARDIQLQTVLKEIAAQTQVRIHLRALNGERVSEDFSRLSLENGLRRLSRYYNCVFIYGAKKARQGEHALEEVILFPRGDRVAPGRVKDEAYSAKLTPGLDLDWGDPESKSPSLLEVEDPEARIEAIESLVDSEDENAVRDIERALFEDEDEDVRTSAALALVNIGDARCIESLSRALEHDDEVIREIAADALAQIEGQGPSGL